MSWRRVDEGNVPVNRPVLVRTAEDEEPVPAFMSSEKIWYSGAALVQNSTNLLATTPVEWCEPRGEDRL